MLGGAVLAVQLLGLLLQTGNLFAAGGQLFAQGRQLAVGGFGDGKLLARGLVFAHGLIQRVLQGFALAALAAVEQQPGNQSGGQRGHEGG